MEPVAFTIMEGGEWYEFWRDVNKKSVGPGYTIHAVKFANGAIFDAVNGWRKNAKVRVKMGRAVV